MNVVDGKLVFEKPFRVDETWVYDANDVHVLDVRGYGYLTGGGGLNLPEDEAIEIQDHFLARVIKCLNSHDALVEALEDLTKVVKSDYSTVYLHEPLRKAKKLLEAVK